MGAAAAQIGFECGADLGVARGGLALQQRLRAHHHARDAVAALRRLLVDEGRCIGPGSSAVPRPSTVVILRPSSIRTGDDAGEDRLAVDQHRAGAALAETAAELGAVQREIVAQHVEERRVGIGVDLMVAPVDRQLHHEVPRGVGTAGAAWAPSVA